MLARWLEYKVDGEGYTYFIDVDREVVARLGSERQPALSEIRHLEWYDVRVDFPWGANEEVRGPTELWVLATIHGRTLDDGVRSHETDEIGVGTIVILPLSPGRTRIELHSRYSVFPSYGDWVDGIGSDIAEDFPEGAPEPGDALVGAQGADQQGEKTHNEEGPRLPLPAHPKRLGRYGHKRDLTADNVREIVASCRAFASRGGKVPDFYRQYQSHPPEDYSFALDTLRGWLRDPEFAPDSSEPPTKNLT